MWRVPARVLSTTVPRHTRKFNVIATDSLSNDVDLDLSGNRKRNENLLLLLEKKSLFASLGGGEKAIQRHTIKNKKLLVRDRINRLLDNVNDRAADGGFLEMSQLCGLGLYGANVQNGGAVCGIGRIKGKECMIIASDATVSAGAMYPITVKKQLRAQEIAQENQLPVFYIVDSAGAFLPLQSDLFADKEHGGRAFYNQAQMSAASIPQIAIVPGSCTAGGAYMATMSDETIIVKNLGYVYLGGPPLVKAATGEIISDEELGGADVHCEISGVTDHYAENEVEAIQIGRDVAETLPIWEEDVLMENHLVKEPLYGIEDIVELIPAANSRCPLPVHHVLARLLDGSEFHEHRAKYGKTLVCGFGRIGGELIGIVANKGPLLGGSADEEKASFVTVGASSSPASLKGAHFLELCNQRRVPLVFLTDIWDEQAMSKTRRGTSGASRDVAKMIAAVANLDVPKITINVGECSGTTSYAMGGRAMGATFVFSWPNSTVSMESGVGGHTAEEGESEQQRRCPVRDSWHGTSRMWDDGVINPRETRNVLIRSLRIARRQLRDKKNSNHLGVLRM